MKGCLVALAVVLGCTTTPLDEWPEVTEEQRAENLRPTRDRFALEAVYTSSTRRYDGFKNVVTIDAPPLTGRGSGGDFSVELAYVKALSDDPHRESFEITLTTVNTVGWNLYRTAYLLGGRKLIVTADSPDTVGCSACTSSSTSLLGPRAQARCCRHVEVVRGELPEEALRSVGTGFKIQFRGTGEMILELPAGLVAGFLRRVDEERGNAQLPASPGGPSQSP